VPSQSLPSKHLEIQKISFALFSTVMNLMWCFSSFLRSWRKFPNPAALSAQIESELRHEVSPDRMRCFLMVDLVVCTPIGLTPTCAISSGSFLVFFLKCYVIVSKRVPLIKTALRSAPYCGEGAMRSAIHWKSLLTQ